MSHSQYLCCLWFQPIFQFRLVHPNHHWLIPICCFFWKNYGRNNNWAYHCKTSKRFAVEIHWIATSSNNNVTLSIVARSNAKHSWSETRRLNSCWRKLFSIPHLQFLDQGCSNNCFLHNAPWKHTMIRHVHRKPTCVWIDRIPLVAWRLRKLSNSCVLPNDKSATFVGTADELLLRSPLQICCCQKI